MTDFFTDKVTIYNDITSAENGERCFVKTVIEKCQIAGGLTDKPQGTVGNTVNQKKVITRDTARYISPEEYRKMAQEARKGFFTVQTSDFIVFGENAEEVTNAKEFADLQIKHKDNGIKIVSVNVYINGMRTDNIEISNV